MADIEKLYSEYYGFVFKFLLSLCRNESLAEELTQETFYRAYINLKSLRDDGKAAAWLCRISKNLYFAWYRDNKRIVGLDDAAVLSGGADVSSDISEEIVTAELAERAARCIGELEEPYKEVFRLSVFGKVPLKDISAVFGKSESWARVTFYRAKQKIIEKMGNLL